MGARTAADRRGVILNRPALAAITLDPQGGGVATVARLLQRVLVEQWGEPCPVATLISEPGDPPNFDSSTLTRIRFGLRLATLQAAWCDWVLFSHFSLAQVQRFVPRINRRPYAVFLHDIEAWGPMSPARRRILAGAFLRLANSNYTAKRVMAAHPDAGPVYACPLALEPRDDGELPDAGTSVIPALGDQAVVVVGRMSSRERYKGHDQLLEAWPLVVRQVPDAVLVFVGTGDDTVRLREKAAALGVGNSLVCPGFVSRAALEIIYRRAKVFAMPSRREGFGLVYLEAMSQGLPCIGSTHDAAGDIIQDGVSGFLIDQADIGALADRITRLLCDEDQRVRMGEQAARHVAAHFTYERFASRLVSLIPAEYRRRVPSGSSAPGSVF
jgi:phosphatidylinositol alpha-1,6-mannosyltransferase